MDGNSDYEALENFVVANSHLESLETLLERFNIFEAVGVVRQELRHSNLLAFLLDPNQTHGLGEAFLKRFLQRAASGMQTTGLAVTPIDLDTWDLHGATVHREWQNIDILILEESLELAIIIENKIDGTESPGQLKKYRETVAKNFHKFKMLCLYLTPEGEIPSDENYIAVSYELICQVVENLLKTKESVIGRDLLILIRNYAEMLRRHIVGESEITRLCQQIYRKHQPALDLIFEHKPDLQADIRQYLEDLVDRNTELLKDHCSKAYIRFLPREWDEPRLSKGRDWVPSNRMLLFVFHNFPSELSLRLYIGPGEQEVRKKLFGMA